MVTPPVQKSKSLPDRVTIVEVGPRDGLQNERESIPTEVKLAFIGKLVEAGLSQIEATSFVHPKFVPQLADALEVCRALPDAAGVTFSALVPNERGLDRAIEAGVKRVAVFTAASETFTNKNIRMSIEESLATFKPVIERARVSGITVRGYVSTAFVCPYEGEIGKEKVCEITERLLELGADEVAISDTIGAAAPKDILESVGHVLERVPTERIALHLHDTYGTALANVYAGLELGITRFDSSAGGLGGCPFAPGASGNLATEDLVYMLDRMGIQSGVSLDGVIAAAGVIGEALRRDLTSRQWQRLRGRSCQSGN
jgi:hydroxymethylglutaryl-CoA lyase